MSRRIQITICDDGFLNLNAYLVSHHIREPNTLLFYVDTGSPSTIISQNDAEKLGIDISTLKKHPVPLGGFGEGRTDANEIDNVCIVMTTDDNKTYNVVLDMVLIAMRAKRKDAIKKNLHIPNVIGSDFFQRSGLSLFVNLKNSIAYMEEYTR